MKVKTIVEYKNQRWCIKCGLHVNKEDEIDLDFYTARQYINFLSVSLTDRCDHSREKQDSKEELLKRVGSMPVCCELRDLVADIIRRLP